jgi:murein tripeptide amidase MpaA
MIACSFVVRLCLCLVVLCAMGYTSVHATINLPSSVFVHHDYDLMTSFLQDCHAQYPHITQLFSVGQSSQGRDLWVIRITASPLVSVPGRPKFKYVGNMHGNEVVGREVLLYLVKYMLDNYKIDTRVTTLIDTTDIYIMPSMNPDGYEVSPPPLSMSYQGPKLYFLPRIEFVNGVMSRKRVFSLSMF